MDKLLLISYRWEVILLVSKDFTGICIWWYCLWSSFNKEDRVTKEYQYTLNVENKLTQTTISKIDALTKQLLPGATLELYLKDGESLSLIEQWVSTDDAHLIKGAVSWLWICFKRGQGSSRLYTCARTYV